MRALYWFRRDLRLFDNRVLAEAYKRSEWIAAVYLIDTDIFRWRGIDLNHRVFALIFDALRELNKKIRVHVLIGKTREIMDELLDKVQLNDYLHLLEEREVKGWRRVSNELLGLIGKAQSPGQQRRETVKPAEKRMGTLGRKSN